MGEAAGENDFGGGDLKAAGGCGDEVGKVGGSLSEELPGVFVAVGGELADEGTERGDLSAGESAVFDVDAVEKIAGVGDVKF